MKARLLAAFSVLLIAFVVANVGKLLWIQPPHLPVRLLFNLGMALAGIAALQLVRRGRIELAGNMLVVVSMLPVCAALLLVSNYVEPLGAAFQLFAFNVAFLLVAIAFATRGVAVTVLIVSMAAQVFLHLRALETSPIAGSMRFAADTLLRDGLIALGFVFCLGITLVHMIEAAHRRSEESLRESRATNENLERLVAERTRDLEEVTRRANEAARAKGDFLANMSHEIRTPLNGIIATADLLQHRSDLSPAAAQQARLIIDSGDLLLRLLGDILDFSKIEARQLVLEARPFGLRSLVSDSLALMNIRAVAQGVLVDSTVAPELDGYFEGDGFRLRQILLNLLSNAVKFTPSGGRVHLTIDSPDPQARPTPVRFEVRDTGIGMDEPMMSRLFERFTQADSSTTRRYGGTGLGLSISLHLVGMMGGKLEAESTLGRGSVFHFTIPLPSADAVPESPSSVAEGPWHLGLRVLVAEDNAVNRRILAAQLEKLGCSTVMAVDGAEALLVLQGAALPDVILMDCHMPRLDGWGATQQIRAWADEERASGVQREAATLPIVALTAAALPEERERCLAAGMTDFLAKPVKLAELRRALEPFVRAASMPA